MKRIAVSVILGCSVVIGSYVGAAPRKEVVVGPYDTVYGIAYNHGIPTRALIAANNLKPPHTLTPGQVLVIPGPNEHIVGNGETLETIAEEHGVNVDVLAQENNISSPAFVKQGDALSIPSPDTESLTEALAPASTEITTSSLAPLPTVKVEKSRKNTREEVVKDTTENETVEKETLPDDLASELAEEKKQSSSKSKKEIMGNLAEKKDKKFQPKKKTAPKKEEVVEETFEEEVQISFDDKENEKVKKEEKKPLKKEEEKKKKEEHKDSEQDKKEETKELAFSWPIDGERVILSKFGAEGKNDGINIKVDEGDDVKAAASGEVMYAGSELKDFGNLLLIKHKDGWVTAYAHLSKLAVKKGDPVKQNDVIGQAGKTGSVKEPQLHFEIRKGKKPVNPSGKLKS